MLCAWLQKNRGYIFTAVTVSLLSLGSVALAADEATDKRTPKATAKSAESSTEIEKKLKDILKNQEQILANQVIILQKFEAVMEELRIVKVRATMHGGGSSSP